MASTMAAARPTVSVFTTVGAVEGTTTLPAIFTAPIRPDVVTFVHTQMNKNKRQAYAVDAERAGMQTAAESWGTGRAVSRIPRVPGGGTHRAGQAAFGNMCRGGRMFNPTRVWRKWHRKINKNQRRYALASAIAASAVPALVMARGHRIGNLVEVPMVLDNTIEAVKKTQKAVSILEVIGAAEDVQRCKDSKAVRAGHGKMRNRRYVNRRGPLIVYSENGADVEKAVRNLTGVDSCHVDRLNLLQLAPGGHVGRFVIWSKGAIEKLDALYGTYTQKSELKSNYSLPRTIMSNADLTRLINSDEVQKVVKPAQSTIAKKTLRKKNPLKNLGVMVKLNPYALAHRRAELRNEAVRKAQKGKKKAAAAGNTKAERKAFYDAMLS